jgi:outer membrane lipoprotein LolB
VFESVAAVVAGLALVGCAGAPPRTEALPFTAAGRLSVRVEPSPTRLSQSLSAAFEWHGDGERGELTLLSPLGTQVARANWSPGDARLITPEGEARFDTLDALAERALGEAVPLAAWPDWLAGRPWPRAPSQPWGSAGGTGFEQLGWSVDLSRFAEGRIEARRSTAPVVTVRIVLDKEEPAGRVRP